MEDSCLIDPHTEEVLTVTVRGGLHDLVLTLKLLAAEMGGHLSKTHTKITLKLITLCQTGSCCKGKVKLEQLAFLVRRCKGIVDAFYVYLLLLFVVLLHKNLYFLRITFWLSPQC